MRAALCALINLGSRAALYALIGCVLIGSRATLHALIGCVRSASLLYAAPMMHAYVYVRHFGYMCQRSTLMSRPRAATSVATSIEMLLFSISNDLKTISLSS